MEGTGEVCGWQARAAAGASGACGRHLVATGGDKPGKSGAYATWERKRERRVWKAPANGVGGRHGHLQVPQVLADGNWWQLVATSQVNQVRMPPVSVSGEDGCGRPRRAVWVAGTGTCKCLSRVCERQLVATVGDWWHKTR